MLFAIEGAGMPAPPPFPASDGPPRRSAAPALRALAPGEAMPAWCDRYLSPARRDALGGRAWYDTTLTAGMPERAEPLLALCAAEAVLIPLMRLGGRLQSMTTPYSLSWRPLVAGLADDGTMRAAGCDLGRLLRGGPPAVLDCLAQEEPGLEAFIGGLRAAGLVPLRFAHFGNWHEAVTPEDGWDGYLSDRASALQSTIRRKTPRCLKRARFEWIVDPGPRLEAGIAAYEAVRARSWKPFEPSPGFDGALMRAMAAEGTLRLGVLRLRDGDVPVAAQYWAVSGGRAVVLKLAHDEAQRDLSPGTVLTALMMADILDGDGTVHEVDFGRGDDPYKRLWAGQRRQRLGLLVADPRHPAGVAAIGRHAAGLLRRSARHWWKARPWGRRNEA
ncbi:GNAT family N-acetyltransferase [Roseomonas sp. KE2513]|uniref:GNAT family N-acetyltransferase n=1 Tax=Roseomonas sp. KE2513 TaxID=2479202 RepID=UPI0018E041DC|nr:GNAT family N-acetyltransferase [Roseomonas sp. KE2513]MBI0537865.1 GNAT family N-acetyltransferase [Roseomonas sp. KE2513]